MKGVIVSNIAWEKDQEAEVFRFFQQQAITGLEIAPTKIWSDLNQVSLKQVEEYRNYLHVNRLQPVAAQSVLYGRPDLQIFTTKRQRDLTLKYLQKVIDILSLLEIKHIVFGSPKNRYISDDFKTDSKKIALEFFYEIGEYCKQKDLTFCLEPNAPQYSCNFLTNTSQTVAFIEELHHTHVQLHLDTAVMTLNKENMTKSFEMSQSYLKHMHVSEPFF